MKEEEVLRQVKEGFLMQEVELEVLKQEKELEVFRQGKELEVSRQEANCLAGFLAAADPPLAGFRSLLQSGPIFFNFLLSKLDLLCNLWSLVYVCSTVRYESYYDSPVFVHFQHTQTKSWGIVGKDSALIFHLHPPT